MIFLNHGLLNMKARCIDFFGNYFSLVTQIESVLFFLVLLLMAINSTQQLRDELLQKRDNRLFTFSGLSYMFWSREKRKYIRKFFSQIKQRPAFVRGVDAVGRLDSPPFDIKK